MRSECSHAAAVVFCASDHSARWCPDCGAYYPEGDAVRQILLEEPREDWRIPKGDQRDLAVIRERAKASEVRVLALEAALREIRSGLDQQVMAVGARRFIRAIVARVLPDQSKNTKERNG